MNDEKEAILPLSLTGKRKRLGIIVTTSGVTSPGVEFGTSFPTLLAFLLVSIASSAVISVALVVLIFWMAKG